MWVISDQELCSGDIREFLGKYSKRGKVYKLVDGGMAVSHLGVPRVTINYGMSVMDPF